MVNTNDWSRIRTTRPASTQILVIGASASGTCAAVQAGRMGERVVVCEPTGWVGGMLTAAGVSAIDGNNRLPAGLWGEFQRALRDHYGGAEAVETGWVSNTLYDPRVGQAILRGWIEALPQVELRTHRVLHSIIKNGDRVEGARFVVSRFAADPPSATPNDMVIEEVRAEVTIFADEYGDAVVAAGLPRRTGLESQAQTGEPEAPEHPYPYPQDITWAATIALPPSGFAAHRRGPQFPLGDEYEAILGDPPISWDKLLDYGRLPGDLVMLNWPGQDVAGNYLNPATRPTVLRRARAKTCRLVEALRAAYGEDTVRTPRVYPSGSYAIIPYIREAWRIDAVSTLRTTDVALPGAPLPPDAVAVGDYPVDHHRKMDPDAPPLAFPPIAAFSVPFGVMIPREHDGVIVTEKSIGVSGLVNGCTRLQPVVMQLGQAAGAAAAIAVDRRVAPRAVDTDQLQTALLNAGGYLAPTVDTQPGDPHFAALHWGAVRGYLTTRTESEGWANRRYLDPDAPIDLADIARYRVTADREPAPDTRELLHRTIAHVECELRSGRLPRRREAARLLRAAYDGERPNVD